MHRRVLPIAAAALFSIAGLAHAKPRIAVLGLEVVSEQGGVDEATTQVASWLTALLRQRASVDRGPYELAPDSAKDLVEMKLLSDCSDEGFACMAEMGKELSADHLLYGKVEKRPEGYIVSLNLLDVRSGGMERTVSDTVPLEEADEENLDPWARSFYNRLTGMVDDGSLLVRANIRTGRVFVDGTERAQLTAGRASIDGVSEGEHRVTVDADGWKAWDGTVMVTAGLTSEVAAVMVRGSGGPADVPSRPGGTSRALFWTSLVLTGAGVAAFTVTGLQVRGSLEDAKLDAIRDLDAQEGITLDQGNACDDAENFPGSAGAQRVVSACSDGRSRAKLTNIFIGASVVTAVAAGIFYYKGYVSPGRGGGGEATSAMNRRDRRGHLVRVTPSLGPNVVGAGIEIQF